MIGSGVAGHWSTGPLPHGVGVVLVFHPQSCAQGGVIEIRHVPGRVNVWMAGAQELIDPDAIFSFKFG
jgi:hypothetical protein